MRASKTSHGFRMRAIADPAIAMVPIGLDPGATLERRTHGCTEMRDADSRVRGQEARGERCAKRILHLTKVGEDQHLEEWPAAVEMRPPPLDRLEDNLRLSPRRGRQLAECERLEHNESIGDLEGSPRARAAREIAVEIGAGQGDHDRSLGVSSAEAPYRSGALLRVQSEKEIDVLSAVLVCDHRLDASATQHLRPAERADPIPVVSPRRCRANNESARGHR